MNLSKHISSKRGFTLIELLIVIGILGILAAGLLAAIDPLEQLKKGRDNSRRTVAVEFTNAVQRYYAVFGTMPWGNSALAAANISAATGVTIINELTAKGELKTSFQNGLGAGLTTGAYALTLVGGDQVNAGISLCFDPESKSISRDPTTLFTTVAYPLTPGTNDGTSDTGHYWCTK